MNRLVKVINRFEDALLVIILAAMILLSLFQILSRNILSEGVVWIDPLLRTLVLWVGLTGAVVATRYDNHIRIDIFTRYFPKNWQSVSLRIVYLVTMLICLVIAWHAARFILSEYEYQTIAFSDVPAWLAGLIIPLSFALMGIRYAAMLLGTPPERAPLPADHGTVVVEGHGDDPRDDRHEDQHEDRSGRT